MPTPGSHAEAHVCPRRDVSGVRRGEAASRGDEAAAAGARERRPGRRQRRRAGRRGVGRAGCPDSTGMTRGRPSAPGRHYEACTGMALRLPSRVRRRPRCRRAGRPPRARPPHDASGTPGHRRSCTAGHRRARRGTRIPAREPLARARRSNPSARTPTRSPPGTRARQPRGSGDVGAARSSSGQLSRGRAAGQMRGETGGQSSVDLLRFGDDLLRRRDTGGDHHLANRGLRIR